MTYESIYEKVVKITAEGLGIEESKIQKDSKFQDDLGADSLGLVEMIMKLEEEFDLDIPEDESEKLKTVDDVVKYIYERKK